MPARLCVLAVAILAAAGLGACGSGSAVRTTAVPRLKGVHLPQPTEAEKSAYQSQFSDTEAYVTKNAAATRKLPLTGKVVGVDPGHNGRSYTDPSFLDAPIFNGRESEACDTTGTETNGGYSEAEFNWRVATFLTHDLQAEGARVVLTRHSNTGIGPCVTTRAAIINDAHANVAVSIHADGAPASGHGFAILTPVADGPNNHVIAASNLFARDLRSAFASQTGMPYSTYDGVDALQPRDNLAGENLTRVPRVLIECGNMRNAGDAALETSTAWQEKAAAGIAAAITYYLAR